MAKIKRCYEVKEIERKKRHAGKSNIEQGLEKVGMVWPGYPQGFSVIGVQNYTNLIFNLISEKIKKNILFKENITKKSVGKEHYTLWNVQSGKIVRSLEH